ncbi:hypothetical protein ACU635_29795 [[Actinomadura] parvosata]|uniref:hypothetical protein n=1 Tax=[Actinomadura] parvosata TaxID=1955412 RepID=UPI00406C01D8
MLVTALLPAGCGADATPQAAIAGTGPKSGGIVGGQMEDGAVVRDRERKVCTDPDKAHAIDHVGKRFRVAGPRLAEPSPSTAATRRTSRSSPARR